MNTDKIRRQLFGNNERTETPEEASMVHGKDIDELMEALNQE